MALRLLQPKTRKAIANNGMETNSESPIESLLSTKRPLFWGLISALFFFFLILFTLTKLPETKMTSLVQGYMQKNLDPFGIYITDQGRSLSIWRGFQYRLEKPTFELSDGTKIEGSELILQPSWSSLLKAKLGATVRFVQNSGELDVTVAGRGDSFSLAGNLSQLSIAKLGLLSYAGQIKGNGFLSGNIQIDGSVSDLQNLAGNILIQLKNLELDEQSIMGFQLNSMKVADGAIDIELKGGKALFKNVRLGKPGSADDLNAQVSGEVTLNRYLNSSALNLRAIFGLSENVKQKLSLIDSILGAARQKDGRYAYKIGGTLSAPFPMPEPNL